MAERHDFDRERERGFDWDRERERRPDWERERNQGSWGREDRERNWGRPGPGSWERVWGSESEAPFGTGQRGFGTTNPGGMSTYGGPGSYSGGMGSYTGRGRYTGRGPKGYQRSDDRIREDVCERLTQHPDVDATDIEIQVRDGEVTLTGTVEDRHSKRIAEDVAENISGVKDVHNQIRVHHGVAEPETRFR